MSKKERESNLKEKEIKMISDMLDKFAFDNVMDRALQDDDFEAAQEINENNDYYKAIAKNSEN